MEGYLMDCGGVLDAQTSDTTYGSDRDVKSVIKKILLSVLSRSEMSEISYSYILPRRL